MAPKVCTQSFSQGGYSARVGDVLDSSSYVASTYSSFFTDADDITISDDFVVVGDIKHGTAADAATIKGHYLTAAVAVSVPAISGTAVLPTDSVVVDISTDGALTFAAAVGDVVRAIPQEALEGDCLLVGAYVVNTDSIEVVFAAKEGGDGVTNANKNFKFLITDLT